MGVTEEEQPVESDEPEQPRRECWRDRKIVGRKLICGCGKHILTFSDPLSPNDPDYFVP